MFKQIILLFLAAVVSMSIHLKNSKEHNFLGFHTGDKHTPEQGCARKGGRLCGKILGKDKCCRPNKKNVYCNTGITKGCESSSISFSNGDLYWYDK